MHSTSNTWISPKVKEDRRNQTLNFARRKICPKSTFWTNNFDLAAHNREWCAMLDQRPDKKKSREKEAEQSARRTANSSTPTTMPAPEPPPIRACMGGKDFETSHGVANGLETIFVPQWQKSKLNIAEWPSKVEMKYEGDDRISTDKLHRRFPGAPRSEGNDTVNWQHRTIIAQYYYDEFYYPIPNEVDIFMKTHWIADLEIDDEEGKEALGRDLMGMLDPVDEW